MEFSSLLVVASVALKLITLSPTEYAELLGLKNWLTSEWILGCPIPYCPGCPTGLQPLTSGRGGQLRRARLWIEFLDLKKKITSHQGAILI